MVIVDHCICCKVDYKPVSLLGNVITWKSDDFIHSALLIATSSFLATQRHVCLLATLHVPS